MNFIQYRQVREEKAYTCSRNLFLVCALLIGVFSIGCATFRGHGPTMQVPSASVYSSPQVPSEPMEATLVEGALRVPIRCTAREEGLVSFVNSDDGYCLLYPARFRVGDIRPGIANIYGPPLDQHALQPIATGVSILVLGSAADRTLVQIVDEHVKPYADQSPLTRTTAKLGGELAVVVEGVTDRVGSRQIFVIHNGIVYHLTFYPVDEAYPQAASDVEDLWKIVVASFSFLSFESNR